MDVEGIGGEIFQIATSKEHTVNEVVELLKMELKEKQGVDMQLKYGHPRVGDVKRNFSDTSKARKILGWQAKIDLREGLERTLEWFRNQER